MLSKHTYVSNSRNNDKEGGCKVEASLIAVTADHQSHSRPLCTSADLSLAMHELMDPKIFSVGIIQMPHLLPAQYERHLEGVYRFNFCSPLADSTWQYIK
jgi:hypothetical protein